MKILTLTALVCSLTLSPLYASPQATCPASCNCDKTTPLQKLLLTSEQERKIMHIIAENMNTQRTVQFQLDAVREQIEALVSGYRLDEKNLDRLIKQQTMLLGKRMKDRALTQHKIYNLLTAEQKVHFKQIHQFWKLRTEDLNQLKSN